MDNNPNFMVKQGALHRMLMQHHPQIGQMYVPGLKARVPNETGGFYIRTNSQGFRSDIEFKQKRGDKPRILFLGDSFTAGFWVDNQQRFSNLIGSAFDAEVYNYGVSGTGTDQQVLIYEQFAKKVEADLIVVGVMVENIERNLRTHHRMLDRFTGNHILAPKPYFTLEHNELYHHNSPVPIERPDAPEEDYAGNKSVVKRGLNAVRDLYWQSRRSILNEDARPDTVNRDDLMTRALQRTNFQPYAGYRSADSEGWQLMSALLRRLFEQTTDTPVLLVPIPDSYFYRAHSLKPLYQPMFEQLSTPYPHVQVMDLTTPLDQLSVEEKSKLPFVNDFHFSPYGNWKVAQIITDEIRNRRLLPVPASRPVHKGKSSVKRDRYILGISCFYHNSAATLLKNGKIVAAAEEERFTRSKADRNFPQRAINYCLEEAGIHQNDLEAIVYYDNAYKTFERLMHTQLAIGERGSEAWQRVLPSWLQFKLSIPELIRTNLNYDGTILHDLHHRSHAASAFYPSPFKQAAIVTIDGVGEWATATISRGKGGKIELLKEMKFPHSVGLLYSAFTQFIGFKVNNGEYKMMGLAPYGNPTYVDLIKDNIVAVKDDGSIELNMEYFAFLSEPTMTTDKFTELFDGPPRHPKEPITQREMDIAQSIQVVTEEIVLKMAQHAFDLTGEKYLCLAGGVALNCVANGRLLREGPFEDLWIQPAAGDSGCALGAALDVWHTHLYQPRYANKESIQKQSLWGPEYSDAEIKAFLDSFGFPYAEVSAEKRADKVAGLIEEGNVIGHFAGRLEYGPRALGSRSIVGDARSQEMQEVINLKIKYRESFRPFAPTVMAECVEEFFEIDRQSPYMLLVAPVRQDRTVPMKLEDGQTIYDVVKQPRSDVPAITHVNYSARIQSVKHDWHPPYHDLINAFKQRTGYGVIINTSFNVRGEPIVCSPYDAYRCFMRTEMDVLVLGNHVLYKHEQPAWPEEKGAIEKYDPNSRVELEKNEMTEKLACIFDKQFMPMVRLVGDKAYAQISMQSHNGPSNWHELTDDNDTFVIPAALQTMSSTPCEMADAILQYWHDGELAEHLRPVVEQLLGVGRVHAQAGRDEEIVEEVSDFTYVMY